MTGGEGGSRSVGEERAPPVEKKLLAGEADFASGSLRSETL